MSEPERRHLSIVPRDASDAPPLLDPRDDEQEVDPMDGRDLVIRDDVDPPAVRRTGELTPTRVWSPRTIDIVDLVVRRMEALREQQTRRRAARGMLGAAVVTTQGAQSWATKAWDAATLGVYRRQIRAAEALGDREALADWVDRRERAVQQRRARLMDLPVLMVNVAKAGAIGCAGVLATLLGVSTAVAAFGIGEFKAVWVFTGDVIAFGLTVASWAWPVVPAALLAAAYREGLRRGTTPRWLLAPADRDTTGEPITPSLLVTALRDLGYAPLRKAIKDMGDAGAAMVGLIRIAGCGVEVDIALPSGVSTKDIQDRRRKLAENLGRHEHEVFITIPKQARTVRLWIADSGALDEPIGPSLLAIDPDMTADLYTGRAPWGQDLRGDAATVSLLQLHLLITGLSNQGKTAALRALALWLALDVSVEFRIADLKGVGDWRMFAGLATVLIQGPTDEHVIAATEMVEAGVAEMERRIDALEKSGATDGVTRDMARKDPRFKPLVLIVDEAQVAFMCPAREEYVTDDGKVKQGAPYGGTKATSRYFNAVRKIHNQGRAVNVTLWQGTQDPTDQNLPKLVREGAHLRASLVVGTESQARMALGDKAVDGGASPHLLRQGLDKGTLVTNGGGMTLPPGQSSITIRTHYVSGEEAAEIADRAKMLRGAVETADAVEVEERDLLQDVATVLGDETRPLADLPALLSRLAPRWVPYERLTGKQLREQLAEFEVKVPSTGNRWPVAPELIRDALAARVGREDDDDS